MKQSVEVPINNFTYAIVALNNLNVCFYFHRFRRLKLNINLRVLKNVQDFNFFSISLRDIYLLLKQAVLYKLFTNDVLQHHLHKKQLYSRKKFYSF